MVKKTTEGAKIYQNNMVRVNSDVQKIDKFFHTAPKSTDKDEKYDISLNPKEISKANAEDTNKNILPEIIISTTDNNVIYTEPLKKLDDVTSIENNVNTATDVNKAENNLQFNESMVEEPIVKSKYHELW